MINLTDQMRKRNEWLWENRGRSRYAIESDNKERQAELEVAIREHELMMIEDALKAAK